MPLFYSLCLIGCCPQILDDKTLIQKYRNEINELKKKLAAAEEAERRHGFAFGCYGDRCCFLRSPSPSSRRYKEMERLATEKQRVEEANESLVKKLEEQEELRAKLEEKIRHLTRLILRLHVSATRGSAGALSGN